MKILLIIQREFLAKVRKKSFLITTILVPLIFPLVIGGMIYLSIENKKNKVQETIEVLDHSGQLSFEDSKLYRYKKVEGDVEEIKTAFSESEHFGLIYIPVFEIDNPTGFMFYTKNSTGVSLVSSFEQLIQNQISDIKLEKSGLTKEQLQLLDTKVHIAAFNISESGEEKKSDSRINSAIGYATGFLIYLFLFVYGGQVMQGVIEEKSSRVVEVIISTVRPFQMMIGKVVGVAMVGVLQFLIWIILITSIFIIASHYLGVQMNPAEINSAMPNQIPSDIANTEVQEIFAMVNNIPFVKITLLFLFYFVGGYLLYGSLFAAVGAAVDTPGDAQQFMLPISLPIVVAFMGMSVFVFDDPNGTVSFWLSIIPFTSPIVMMGRVGFWGFETWELILSMLFLVLGFIFTIWLAGRIYRIGIMMHGSKVSYKVLLKWLVTKY